MRKEFTSMDKETLTKKKVNYVLTIENIAKLEEISKATGIPKSSLLNILIAKNADTLKKNLTTTRKESGSL